MSNIGKITDNNIQKKVFMIVSQVGVVECRLRVFPVVVKGVVAELSSGENRYIKVYRIRSMFFMLLLLLLNV